MVTDLFAPLEDAAAPAAAAPVLVTAADVQRPLEDDVLAALVLPWAQEHHPEKAAHVESKRGDRAMFRRLCGRLIELRWDEDRAWRGTVPLMALHETALVVRLRSTITGTVLAVSGRHAPKPHRWTFQEIAYFTLESFQFDTTDAFVALVAAKDALDLTHHP